MQWNVFKIIFDADKDQQSVRRLRLGPSMSAADRPGFLRDNNWTSIYQPSLVEPQYNQEQKNPPQPMNSSDNRDELQLITIEKISYSFPCFVRQQQHRAASRTNSRQG